MWLEIGFGSGEHLLWQAEQHKDIGFIGCEPFVNGMGSLLGAIEDRGIATIRVHDGDARDVLAWLPDRSIARIVILFPDPWPKKRQLKRRLISDETVSALARVLAAGGELRFASDSGDYAAQTLSSWRRAAPSRGGRAGERLDGTRLRLARDPLRAEGLEREGGVPSI